MSDVAPFLEVTEATVDAAARRLTTVAKVTSLMEEPPAASAIEALIDDASAAMAQYARLATDAIGTPPTFGLESLKATWLVTSCDRGRHLLLPWRVPVVEITSVIEDGVELTADDDYRLTGGGMLMRISSDTPICWSRRKIIVEYDAGWDLATAGAPAELSAACAEQVKFRAMAKDIDPNVRNEEVPDTYSVTYNMPGGLASTNTGESGLLTIVEAALARYRAIFI